MPLHEQCRQHEQCNSMSNAGSMSSARRLQVRLNTVPQLLPLLLFRQIVLRRATATPQLPASCVPPRTTCWQAVAG
jgi:hypothetical protein